MENQNRQYAKSLTPHAAKVLNVIRAADSSLTRAEIALALGKRQLTPWDVAVLEMLEDRGYIKQQSRPVVVEFSYELVEE